MASRALFSIFVAVLAVSPTPARADASAPVQKLTAKFPSEHVTVFAATYDSQVDIVGDIRLNDVALATFSGKGNSGSSGELGRWLVPGTNQLDITFTKVPGPDSPIMRDELVNVGLHALAQRGMPEQSNAFIYITLRKPDLVVGTRRFVFDVPETQAPASQIYKRAAVLTSLGDEDKRAVGLLCTKLLDAMKRGDLATVKQLMQFSIEDGARMSGMPVSEMSAMFEQMLPEMRKTFGGARLQPDSLDYRLGFGGRVIFVTKKDGSAPLVVKEKDGGVASMTFHASKLDGKWTIVP